MATPLEKTLLDSVQKIVLSELSDVLEGAESDLKSFGADIAKEVLKASASSDLEWRAQLLDQIKLLGEINRIRTNAAGWQIAFKVISAAFQGLGFGVKAALAL
jgi:hypothetical protein